MITLSSFNPFAGLLNKIAFNYSKPRKIQNLNQRLKRYGKYPDLYQLKTLIRPPNLRDPDLQFPIRIPIRYRHIRVFKKPLFAQSTKEIRWNRLTPNQILLAFQNIQYLSHKQIVEGLEYLSRVQGQQNHDWNDHPWVSQAFLYMNSNFARIKKVQTMKFYYLMKKLNNKNIQFWHKLYKKIQQQIYDLYPSDFQNLFLTYYKKSDQYFSTQMKANFLKLMQNRLRQFKNQSILQIFQIFMEQNRLDTYWLQNVFISLFKQSRRHYTSKQVGQIFRYMMIIGHEKNDRLYESLYNRILKAQYKQISQVEELIDIVSQVKYIFTSHRVQSYLQFLQKQKQKLQNFQEQKKISLHEIVRQDLIFFLEKKKMQAQIAANS